MALIFGDTDNTPGDISTVSSSGRADTLQSGYSNGAANTGYQRFYGGGGADTFAFRARDFDVNEANPNAANKFISDFEGAKGSGPGGSNGGDFISFRQFGEGAHLELQEQSYAGSKPGAVVYSYHILGGDGGNELLGVFNVQSLNGQVLGAGDYNFF